MTRTPNKKFLYALILLSIASSVLPWFLTAMAFPDLPESRLVGFVQDFIFPVLWLALVLFTIGYGRWEKRLWWLFVLSPVAFAHLLFYLWFGLTFKAP